MSLASLLRAENEFINSGELHGKLQKIAAPLYCTTLDKAKFLFASDSLAQLLGYDAAELTADGFSATSLYLREADRDDWAEDMRRQPGMVTSVVELVRKPSSDRHERLLVIDLSLLIDESENIAIGVLGDVSQREFDRELLQSRLAAFEQILDLPWVNVGIHQIDSEGFVLWMNQMERNLLGFEPIGSLTKHVVSLSGPGEHLGKRHRVKRKLLGICPLTQGEHRTFINQQKGEPVPVNIHDFPVAEPDPIKQGRWHRELITVVRDEQSQIAELLGHFLPQNPLLEDLGIHAFTKARRKYASEFNEMIAFEGSHQERGDELVFTFGNSLFVSELQTSSVRGGAKVASRHDVYGKTEQELFPRHAKDYGRADRDVLEHNARDERIEKHPGKTGGEVDVQVVKIPMYLPGDEEKKNPVGVQGFYWYVEETDIREQLKQVYEPWGILDAIPVPVYRKNRDFRFTYANLKYLEDIVGLSEQGKLKTKVRSLGDIIGKKDEHIFEGSLATSYQGDDKKVIEEGAVIDQIETHGEHLVRVVKTPIGQRDASESKFPGLQGIFWKVGRSELRPPIWIDGFEKRLHVFGRDPIEVANPNHQIWQLFQLLANSIPRPVSDDTIGLRVFGHQNASGKKLAMGQIRKCVHDLGKALNKTYMLGDTIKIKRQGSGYRMTLYLHPEAKARVEEGTAYLKI